MSATAAPAAEAISSLSLFAAYDQLRREAYVYSEGELIGRAVSVVWATLSQLSGEGRTDVGPAVAPILGRISTRIRDIADAHVSGVIGDSPTSFETEDEARAILAGLQEPTTPVQRDLFDRLPRQIGAVAQFTESVVNYVGRPGRWAGRSDPVPHVPPPPATVEPIFGETTFGQWLRSNLHWGSDVVHHGVRLGTALFLMILAYGYADVPIAIFMALAIIATVQPDLGTSVRSAIQISVYTVLGVVIAILVVLAFPNEWAVMVALAIFSFLALAFSGYAPVVLFALMSPIFILLFTFNALGQWGIAVVRLGDTVVGVVIGIACCLIFWPQSTAKRWVPRFAATLRAVGDAAGAVFAAYRLAPDPERPAEAHMGILRALWAEGDLRSETKLLKAQPRQFALAGAFVEAHMRVMDDCMLALNVASGGLLTNATVTTDPFGPVIGARLHQLADRVDAWERPGPAPAELIALVRQAQDSVLYSPAADRSVVNLGHATKRFAYLIDQAMDISPTKPLSGAKPFRH